MKKLILILLTAVLLLSACSFKAIRTTNVQSNGTSTVDTLIVMDTSMYQLLSSQEDYLAKNKSDCEKSDNGIFKSWTDDAQNIYEDCIKSYKNIEDLNNAQTTTNEQGVGIKFLLSVEKGLIQDVYTLHAAYTVAPADPSMIDASALSAMFSLKYIVTLPGTVDTTNGLISTDDPNTVTWNIPLNATNTILTATSKYWHLPSLVYILCKVLHSTNSNCQ